VTGRAPALRGGQGVLDVDRRTTIDSAVLGPETDLCAAVIHARASAVSTRYEYVWPEQMELATNELTARTMLVPPSSFGSPESPKQVPLGSPESPKQVPPLLECSLMNSSLIESLLAIKVVAAKKRVVASPRCFLHGRPTAVRRC
jgi:hypothetical protein